MKKACDNKVSIVGVQGLPARYGGFETFSEQLVLRSKNSDYFVYCERWYKNIPFSDRCTRIFIPLRANGALSILYDAFSILHSIIFHSGNVLLILGCSGAWILPFLPRRARRRIFFHPDGLEYNRTKFNSFARHGLKLLTHLGISFAPHIISDNVEISKEIKELCDESKLHYIPYGGDHAVIDRNNTTKKNFYVATCRIVPENNVGIILEAFSNSNENLYIFGNWYSSAYGRNLYEEYKNRANIKLLQPEYDLSKLNEVRMFCKGYIHGHSVGGTNPSLVEALYYTDTIIAFDCKFNRSTLLENGAYFCDVASLQEALHTASGRIPGEVLSTLQTKYSWDMIVSEIEKIWSTEMV